MTQPYQPIDPSREARQPYPIGDTEYGQAVQVTRMPQANPLLIDTYTIIPVISTAIYASGDAIGGILEIPIGIPGDIFSPYGAILHSVSVIDLDKRDAAIDFLLFDSRFTPTADNAVMSVTNADLIKFIGTTTVSSYYDFSANSVGYARGLNLPLTLNNGAGMVYAQAVVRGTPTYTTVASLTFRFTFLKA